MKVRGTILSPSPGPNPDLPTDEIPLPALSPGPLSPQKRARRVRHRVCRTHRGGRVPRHRGAGARGAVQSRPPRRPRLRGQHRRRRRHPHPDTGPLLQERAVPAGGGPAGAGPLRRRHAVPAPRRSQSPRLRAAARGDRRGRGAGGPGLARRAHRRGRSREHGALLRALHPAAVHRRRLRVDRGARLRAQALRHRQAGQPRDPPRRPLAGQRVFLLPEHFLPHHRLQGDADPRPGRELLHRPVGPAPRIRHRPRPLPLQHQHLPELGAGAPVPLPDPQRRDQHSQGQRELDAHAPVDAALAAVRRRPREALPRHRGGRQRLGEVRQLPRVPAPRRPLPRPRGDDDDPRAVGEARVDVRREEGVLRVPRLPDGTVGRSGLDRLHRRHPGRGRARPQRPAPVPLLRHRRRPRHHGFRGRRARRRAGERPAQGPPAAGADVSRRHRRGPHHRRRGAEAALGDGAPVPAVARRAPRRFRGPPRGRVPRTRARTRRGPAASAGVRVHLRGPARQPDADGPQRHLADRLDGERRGAGGAVRPAAAPVQLLQAAVRAGHQPAHRPDQGGAGHRDRDHPGVGAELPRARAGELPPAAPDAADSDQRRDGQTQGGRPRPG